MQALTSWRGRKLRTVDQVPTKHASLRHIITTVDILIVVTLPCEGLRAGVDEKTVIAPTEEKADLLVWCDFGRGVGRKEWLATEGKIFLLRLHDLLASLKYVGKFCLIRLVDCGHLIINFVL